MPLARWRSIPASIDLINLVLGSFLFFTPWIFSFSSDAARQNAWYMGALIALVSLMQLGEFAEWAEWINLTIGTWVLASAWIPRLLCSDDGNAGPLDGRSRRRHLERRGFVRRASRAVGASLK